MNSGHEIEALTSIHNTVGILGALAFLAMPIGLVAVVVLLIGRLLARVSQTRAG